MILLIFKQFQHLSILILDQRVHFFLDLFLSFLFTTTLSLFVLSKLFRLVSYYP